MVSSHYHFAIFLVIFVATATDADTSCTKTGNLITCELDVNGLDETKYLNFLAEVRKSLEQREIQGVSVLPPQNRTNPPQWLDLKLKAEGKETTVKIRGDNLYVVGYQTQETPPKWYELKDSNYIPGATHLSFSGDYPAMLKAAKLESITEVQLSKTEFILAVKALADPKPSPSEEAGIAKAVILVAQMVSEACRFDRIAKYFAPHLDEGCKLEEWMLPCLERKWAFFSSVVLCDEKYHNEDFVAKTTVIDLLSRLGIILDTRITECDDDCEDELPNVTDLRAYLHDVVESATTPLFWRLLVLILCLVPVMLMIVQSLGRDR